MEEVIANIDGFSSFVICEDAAPSGVEPVAFPSSAKLKDIKARLTEALSEITDKFPGKKLILRAQRQEEMRARHVRVARIPGSQLYIFVFLRDPDAIFAKDRYEVVPTSLLSFFHKAFKLANFTASVEERGEGAFKLRDAQTMTGFKFPIADARYWLDRYRKSQGISKKRPASSSASPRHGKALKKLKTKDGAATPSLFTPKSAEEYERRKKYATSLGLRILSEPKIHDLVDLADLEEDVEHGFEVVPGSHLGNEARPLCAEDFWAFLQPPTNNYFISMATGLDPIRAKAMTKSKVLWSAGKSSWPPSTMMSIVARSEPRMRNFDAIVRSVLENSKIAAGLNIATDPFTSLQPRSVANDDDRDDDAMSDEEEEDLFGEDGTITDEALLLKHSDTLKALQDAALHLALEAYSAKLFATPQ